jgi:DNA-binding response OmpR family regulator
MRRVVLVVDSQPQRLDRWQRAVREAGWLPLPAPTVARARALLQKVRPHLVLSAAHLADGHSADLLRALRAAAQLDHVPLAVLGALRPEEHEALAGDPRVCMRAREDRDAVIGVLTQRAGRLWGA